MTRVWRWLDGASRTVIPAYAAGAAIGLITGVPITLAAGTGVLVGLVLGAFVEPATH